MDAAVIGFAVALVFLCAVFAGAVSSFSVKAGQILSSLQQSSRSHSGDRSQAQVRQSSLAVEVGLTVVLLIGAGLMLKS